MLKIDIEGAEIEVIENMFRHIKPTQICVEFDELNKFNKQGEKDLLKQWFINRYGYQFSKYPHIQTLFTLDT